MMKVGRMIKDTLETIEINVEKFDINSMVWKELGTIPFSTDKEIFGSGAFRDVYCVTSSHPMFSGQWVMKKYNATAINAITEDPSKH